MTRSLLPAGGAAGFPPAKPSGPRGRLAALASSFPARLRLGRATLLALVLIASAAWAVALRAVDTVTRTIGHDTTASIVAAERTRTLLADANGDFANILLSAQGKDDAYVSAFRQDMRDAEAQLVKAAENVTFGDEENGPIVTMAQDAAQYEQLVGRARGLAESGQRTLALAGEADTLMHFTILPAAAALDRANLDHLTASYDKYRASKTALGLLAAGVTLACLVVLVGVQVMIARETRRLLNPGLVLATLLVGVAGGVAALRLLHGEQAVYVAKEQAFDSIAALSTARAIASDANAAENFWLLAHGDAASQAKYDNAFRVRTGRLLLHRAGAAAAMARQARIEGLLGDELANITFVGERAAAEATLKAWLAYLDFDDRLRALERAGRTADAVALDIGNGPGQSNGAFARFVDAIDRTLAINQAAFDAAIVASEGEVHAMVYAAILAVWLLASVACWAGLHVRLKEYAF